MMSINKKIKRPILVTYQRILNHYSKYTTADSGKIMTGKYLME